MKKLALFLCLSSLAFASQSVSGSVSVTIPNTAPYNATTYSSMRWELRVHGFTDSTSGWPQGPAGIADLGPIQLQGLYGTNTVQAAVSKVWRDSAYDNGPSLDGCCAGKADQLVRVTRDMASYKYTLEICDVTGGSCQTATVGINSGGSTFAGLSIAVEAGKVGFIRWYSSTVPIGTPIPISVTTPADLGDWEFEGSLADTSGHGLTMTGTPTYTTSPLYAPVCNAGVGQTFRVNGVGTLQSSSYVFDGTTPQLTWSQVSGPSTVSFTSTTAAAPSISGFSAFGTYVFGLSVTDGSAQTTTCQVRDGAVVTDANDVVITNNTAVDTLLGPQIRWGANGWKWFDDRHRAEAELQAANMDVYYQAGSSAWDYNAQPANYYDVVAAFYSLYYRSGIDTWRDQARKLADRFWTDSHLAEGAACDAWGAGGMGACWPARSISTLGLVLRALDGRSDMWPGLRIIFNSYATYYLELADISWGLWDIREMAYHLATVSYCAMYDPDSTWRATCKTAIQDGLTGTWTPTRDAAGYWPMLYEKADSWSSSSSVTLVHGNTTVTGTGTAWSAGQFDCSGANGDHLTACTIWFTATAGTAPTSNAGGDSTWYRATYIDPAHIALDRPYEGTSGTHGWLLGDVNADFAGFGAQPFLQGILGMAFDFAAKAIVDVNPTAAATFHNYNVDVSNFLKNYGYNPTSGGVFYGAGFPGCPLGSTSGSDPLCTAGYTYEEARMDNAEALRSVMASYAFNHDSALKTIGDALYSNMWSKPGTGSPAETPDYISSYDDGGWYMAGTPPTRAGHKYMGMGFGIGAGAAWPAIRLGAIGSPTGDTACKKRLNGVARTKGGCIVH